MAPRDRRAPATLVLTATITPPAGVPNLTRVDPVLRRRDYREAMLFYLEQPTEMIGSIVFLENSLSDLSDLRELARTSARGKTVEFVSFDGLDYPPHYGRGYGEFRMLDHGLTASRVLRTLDDSASFWKITGRLKVFNVCNVIRSAPADYSVLIDFLRWPTPMLDLRLFSCTRSGYRRLLEGQYAILREDLMKESPEGFLYTAWKHRIDELGIVPRHRVQPKISGIGGQHNVDYHGGMNVAKHWIRVAARHAVPQLWI